MKVITSTITLMIVAYSSLFIIGCNDQSYNESSIAQASEGVNYVFAPRRVCPQGGTALYDRINLTSFKKRNVNLPAGAEFIMLKLTKDKAWASIWYQGKEYGWVSTNSNICVSENFLPMRKICDTMDAKLMAKNTSHSETYDTLQPGHMVEVLNFSKDTSWARVKTSVHYDGDETQYTAWILRKSLCNPYTFHEVKQATSLFHKASTVGKAAMSLKVGTVLIGTMISKNGLWLKVFANNGKAIIQGWVLLQRIKRTQKEFDYTLKDKPRPKPKPKPKPRPNPGSGHNPISDKFTFPFKSAADKDYVTEPRSFGACRNKCKRRHAGADLYGHIGRPIYAVGDGKVIDYDAFYDGTYELVVDHGDFIGRYGEIKKRLARGVYVGARVRRGQVIAYVGNLKSLNYSMLHFERFTGKARGPLTNKKRPPYQRRSDLVNPTRDLIKWRYP